MSIARLSWVVLLGTISLSLSSVAKADVMWIKAERQACPTVCQQTIFKFAVPAGINPRATKARGTEQVYYVCATDIGLAGWRVGFNIEYYPPGRCYTGFRKSEHYGESYYCLCSDKPMKPIGK